METDHKHGRRTNRLPVSVLIVLWCGVLQGCGEQSDATSPAEPSRLARDLQDPSSMEKKNRPLSALDAMLGAPSCPEPRPSCKKMHQQCIKGVWSCNDGEGEPEKRKGIYETDEEIDAALHKLAGIRALRELLVGKPGQPGMYDKDPNYWGNIEKVLNDPDGVEHELHEQNVHGDKEVLMDLIRNNLDKLKGIMNEKHDDEWRNDDFAAANETDVAQRTGTVPMAQLVQH